MSVVFAILLFLAIGFALALLLDRNARGGVAIGEALLLGTGATAAIPFLYALAGVRWTRPLFLISAAIILIVAWFFAWKRGAGSQPAGGHASSLATSHFMWLSLPFDLYTAIGLAGYALFATIAPVWEFDYLGDWGLKARIFWEKGGIDWAFLERSFHRAIHADYPLLLPMSFDVLNLVRGGWDDRHFGVLNVVFAVALLLIVRRLAMEETGSPAVAAFIAAAMLPFAASPWIGLAEAPMATFGTAAILLLRRGDERVNVAAVLLGLAAFSKNEGLALIVAVAVGLAIAGRTRVIPRLWPAIAIPLPWLFARMTIHLQTDLAAGNVFSRVAAHLEHPSLLLGALARYPVGKPLYWIGIVAAIAILRSSFVVAERFALSTIVLQFAAYIGAYLTSPWDLNWHLRWSWERVVSHLSPTLTYIVLVQLALAIRKQPSAEGATE